MQKSIIELIRELDEMKKVQTSLKIPISPVKLNKNINYNMEEEIKIGDWVVYWKKSYSSLPSHLMKVPPEYIPIEKGAIAKYTPIQDWIDTLISNPSYLNSYINGRNIPKRKRKI